MDAAPSAPRVRVVGARPAGLDGDAVAVATPDPTDVTHLDDADVVVVTDSGSDPITTLQELRGIGVGCPVVVVSAEPAVLRDRASLVPLLPADVTYVTEHDVTAAVHRCAVQHHARRRERAVADVANRQLAQLPRLPVVRSLELLDDLVAFSPIGVVVLELDGTIALVNGVAAAIMDRSPTSLVGQPVTAVAPELAACLPDGRPDGPAASTATEPEEPTEVEVADLVIEVRHWSVEGGAPARVLLLDDVTYRREAERVLAEAYAQERQLAADLREVLAIKDALMSSLSHELRTPVAAAKGMAETLRDQGERLSPEQREHFLDRIVRNTVRLERLIVGLLDLDRLRRGKLAPEVSDVDVVEVVRKAVEEGGTDGRELSLDVADDARRAQVDGMWLERIVVNLLTNANRYTPRGSPLELAIDRDGEALRIRMTDHGPGIPDAQKEALFESFQQGAGGSAAGVGIGLSLVRQFAHLHGGSASIQDTPGGGATFVVLLGDPARVEGARAADRV